MKSFTIGGRGGLSKSGCGSCTFRKRDLKKKKNPEKVGGPVEKKKTRKTDCRAVDWKRSEKTSSPKRGSPRTNKRPGTKAGTSRQVLARKRTAET